jgi:hypothetical protein
MMKQTLSAAYDETSVGRILSKLLSGKSNFHFSQYLACDRARFEGIILSQRLAYGWDVFNFFLARQLSLARIPQAAGISKSAVDLYAALLDSSDHRFVEQELTDWSQAVEAVLREIHPFVDAERASLILYKLAREWVLASPMARGALN